MALPAAASLQPSTRLAPSPASPMAICFPIPEVGQVMTTVVPLIDSILFLSPIALESTTERAVIPVIVQREAEEG
jgi:hypothetical protein